MAIIKIGKIKTTPEKAIKYAVEDKAKILGKDDVDDSINYALRDKKKRWRNLQNSFNSF